METLDIRMRRSGGQYVVTLDRPPLGETTESVIKFAQPMAYYQAIYQQHDAVVEIGQALYVATFDNAVGQLIQRNLDRARELGGLRLQFDIRSIKLASLPWEALFNPAHDLPYALQGDVSISRYMEIERNLTVQPFPQEQRWLYAGASPDDLMPLDLKTESLAIKQALEAVAAAQNVAFKPIIPTQLETFEYSLLSYEPQLVFVSAHGMLDDAKVAYLVLVDEYGDSHMIAPDQLRRLFQQSSVEVAILNVCRSSVPHEEVNYGLAGCLIQAGVHAVVAMQDFIDEDAAQAFSKGFAAALAKRASLDQALYFGRRMMKQLALREQWMLPSLFVSRGSGDIWQKEEAASAGKPAAPQHVINIKQGNYIEKVDNLTQTFGSDDE